MKRIVSNIQNLGFTIMNETVEGSKQKPAGIVIDQTLVRVGRELAKLRWHGRNGFAVNKFFRATAMSD